MSVSYIVFSVSGSDGAVVVAQSASRRAKAPAGVLTHQGRPTQLPKRTLGSGVMLLGRFVSR